MPTNYSSQSLEDLIAAYGESQNTVWIEDKFQVWRHPELGIPIGYAISKDYCITWCNPLCKPEDYPAATSAFVDWCTKEKGLKPIWGCLNEPMSQVLGGSPHNWSVLSCIQDDRLDPTKVDPLNDNKAGVRRPAKHAESEGVSVVREPEAPTGKIREGIDECCLEWKRGRKGVQVHTSNLEPWNDTAHRVYYTARRSVGDDPNKIVGFMFMTKLREGYVIKDCLEYPKLAPKGTSELLILTAIKDLGNRGVDQLTFGPSAAKQMTVVANLKGIRVKGLQATYNTIADKMGLINRGSFRAKFSTTPKPLYVAFPKGGMGSKGVFALMAVLKSDPKEDAERAAKKNQQYGIGGEGGDESPPVFGKVSSDLPNHGMISPFSVPALHVVRDRMSRISNSIRRKPNGTVKSKPSSKVASGTATPKEGKVAKNQLKKKRRAERKAEKKKKRQDALKEKLGDKYVPPGQEPGMPEDVKNEEDFSKGKYGFLPSNLSFAETPSVGNKRYKIEEMTEENDGRRVVFRARLEHFRILGSKMAFIILRQRTSTIQAVLKYEPPMVSKKMVRWISHIPLESIVLVDGILGKTDKEIKTTTIKHMEIRVAMLHVIAKASMRPVFDVEDAARPTAETNRVGLLSPSRLKGGRIDARFTKIKLETRLDNRVLDLRTIENQAIFRINSGVVKLFRTFLDGKDFTEIHTPKLQFAATESGASVFKVQYFKTTAFLAQSPQLHKQMCIAADMERVYEIGPVFRAEDSNTHRHLTEFTGLDLEMAFEEHYHEVMNLVDTMLKFIFSGLREQYKRDIEIVREQFPSDDFVWLDETLRLTYPEAVALLREHGHEIGDYEDMSTEKERALGGIVREKYKTDYYIIDKFPAEVRPFYTMPDPDNPKLSNAFDFFMRGEEILSGAQRVNDAKLLIEQMKRVGIERDQMKAYVEAFELGAPPHAGAGLGLERVTMLFLKLGNIRRSSLFPRDPKRLEP
ncbi:aspartyl-tRNA synthetase [Atractiella rhizophila]|nr:aspartyl-tRNA synthetase [Atractiella rhizophila]